MLTLKATWFVLHDTSYPPNTAVRIGQLILSPRQPTECAGNVGPLPLDSAPIDRIEDKVIYECGTGSNTNLGFSAAVLSLLPFEISGERNRNTSHRYEIERVEEKIFIPSIEYVKKSVFQPEVLKYLA